MIQIYKSVEEFKKRDSKENEEEIRKKILAIIDAVIKKGDQALIDFTEKFDGVKINNLRISEMELEDVNLKEDKGFLQAIKRAKTNIKKYHEKQRRESWFTTEEDGTLLGQKVAPIERVGVYVPGGTAAYPSSVLMNVIPAQVAGVEEIVLVSPPTKNGGISKDVLIAAKELGIKEIYSIGGAQAIAALAYGTETIRPVDKIVGPGNIYVALAKREVFGRVGIDMVAGPSEVVIIADGNANPTYVAADLLSQAEHDVMASSILITPSMQLANQVNKEIEKQLHLLSRKEIAGQSLMNHGGIILVDSLEDGFKQVNSIAPEHLEILVDAPFQWLGKVKHAGAIFLGEYSSEPVGDYYAGPNHVLPTNGSARFSSPLSVDDFLKKSSVIFYSKEALLENGQTIIKIAEREGLDAHAGAIHARLKGEIR